MKRPPPIAGLEMTPQEQRIAIAEACGAIEVHESKTGLWAWFPVKLNGACYIINPPGKEKLFLCPVPNYPEDLNAMHEAQKILTSGQQRTFLFHLCGSQRQEDQELFNTVHATAAQRAEAFLRTLNLWKE